MRLSRGRTVVRSTGLILVLAACAVVALSGCSCSAPEAEPASDGSYPTDERPMSSLELINAAVTAGALEYSTGMLYKVYVMFEPESLPPEFASDVPSKCGTPVISEVQRNWNLLSPDDRAEISRYIEPVGLPGGSENQMDEVTPGRLDDERQKLD